MKTITKEYNIYTIDELSKEAQEKAHKKWIEGNDYYFLSDDMNEKLHELLEENNIKDLNDTSKPGTKPTQVVYSLSYCQGDGAMFEGMFQWKEYTIHIKHSGHYYHYNSKNFSIMLTETEEEPDNYQEVEEAFNTLYVDICKKLERYGYDYIEYEDSMEAFKEACEANEYTFLEDGNMFNN